MSNTPRRIVVTVYDSPQFPAELWRRFRETVSAQPGHQQWVDELRALVERYIREHPAGTATKT